MAKSSSQNNLQKIHTFAQDIEAVRSAQAESTPSNDVSNTPPPKVTIFATETQDITTSTPKDTPPATQLLVPQKIKVPTIRTMAEDSKKTSELSGVTKSAQSPTPTAVTKPEPKAVVQNITKNEERKYAPAPRSITKSAQSPELKADEPTTTSKDDVTPSATPTPAEEKGETQSVKAAPKKPTRDTTYSATVITDTKYKRFSLWKELKIRLSELLKNKNEKKKNKYTTPTALLRKGVVQSATTNTARKTIADYSSIKEKVKARKPEEIPTPNSESELVTPEDTLVKDTAVEKTGFDILATIENETSTSDEPLSQYLKPVQNTKVGDIPVFNRADAKTKVAQDNTNSLNWEHYTDTNNESAATAPEEQNLAPLIPVPLVTVPLQQTLHSVQQSAQEVEPLLKADIPDASSPVHAVRILPTIPPIRTDIPDVDMTTSVTAIQPVTPAETTPEPEEIFSSDETSGLNFLTSDPTEEFVPLTVESPETETAPEPEEIPDYQTQSFDPQEPVATEQYFTQPRIVPTIPPNLTLENKQPEVPSYEYASVTPAEPIAPSPLSGRPIALDGEPEKVVTTISSPLNKETKTNNRVISFITQYAQTFVLGGLVVASVLVVGGIAVTSLIAQFSNPTITTSEHQYFNSSSVHPVTVSPLTPLTIVEKLTAHNNAISVSEIILQSTEGLKVSPEILIQLLALPLDPSFKASILDLRFGWYREEPFLVIKYTGDTIARGALLQWERTMYTDIVPLFNLTTVSPSMLSVFKDTTVNNIDVRVLYTVSGGEEVMYGIVAPGHIIITTNEMSFLNLSSNFNPE